MPLCPGSPSQRGQAAPGSFRCPKGSDTADRVPPSCLFVTQGELVRGRLEVSFATCSLGNQGLYLGNKGSRGRLGRGQDCAPKPGAQPAAESLREGVKKVDFAVRWGGMKARAGRAPGGQPWNPAGGRQARGDVGLRTLAFRCLRAGRGAFLNNSCVV